MIDHRLVKLGKKPAKVDRRTLRLAQYLTDAVPSPPSDIDYSGGVASWGVMLNNDLGCCTIAGVFHAIQVWNLNAGKGLETFADSIIQQFYESWDGYNPSDPSTDQGGVELDVLNQWRQQGANGHSLQAFIGVNPKHEIHVKQAIMLFGGTYIGVELPASAQGQQVWDVVHVDDGSDEAGSWGGHCVFVCGYTPQGPVCITWGALQQMTWAFFDKYCSEAYALLSPDWLKSGISPGGYNIDQLMTDLKGITG